MFESSAVYSFEYLDVRYAVRGVGHCAEPLHV
jgi:hypothetical protein